VPPRETFGSLQASPERAAFFCVLGSAEFDFLISKREDDVRVSRRSFTET
jgi:hypothetical protein